jgi:methionyl-tRNA formyltransferase
MRILFAGTPALAVPSLEKLAQRQTVVGVLTSPDQPSGRGRSCTPSPVKEAALARGLKVLQPSRLDAAFLEEARSLLADSLVVAAYGKIFRPAFLGLFPQGGINLHPSLLPKLRGPSPISAAILAGDSETGVTVQRIALKFDTGDVLARERHPLRGDETTATLSEQLAAVGAELLSSVIAAIDAGKPPSPVAQREEEATYCHPLRKEDGAIDWREPAALLERKVRAFDPWPRAATTFQGQTCLLLKSHPYPGTLGGKETEATPGAVLAADPAHGLLVATGAGVLAVERLQLQFKKPTDWRSFLNGHPEIVGTRLGA